METKQATGLHIVKIFSVCSGKQTNHVIARSRDINPPFPPTPLWMTHHEDKQKFLNEFSTVSSIDLNILVEARALSFQDAQVV